MSAQEAAAADAMDGEMDEQMEDMEGNGQRYQGEGDPDADENGMDDDDDDGDENGEKNEYIKKEFVARPYHSDYLAQTVSDVESFTIKNSR